MPCGWKAAHVDADLGDDDLSAEITDAWMGAQQAYGLTERVEIAVYCLVDLEDGRLERVDLAQALLDVTGMYDTHFGFSTPYVMAMHQAPTNGGKWPEAHLHIEFYPPHRRADRLKYLAGVELGAGTFVNDTEPETTAAELRRADPASLAAGRPS